MQAVIVIDMIVDFVTGKFGGEHARRIVPNIRKLLESARKHGVPVVYVCDEHGRQDPEIPVWGEHAMKGTEGSEIIPELSPEKGDFVLKKRTYSAFFQTGLQDLLQRLGVKEVLLTGVVTNICVQHTAADAFFRGYSVVVVGDCTAAADEESYIRSLEAMAALYGAKIKNSGEIISSWESGR